jgi:ABC-type ATPase with predicted acetyltransferase domain
MKLSVRHRCSDFSSYRAARVKSLFNVECGCNFDLDADLPIEGADWGVGVIVGPSGSGKTSLGRLIFGPRALYRPAGWPKDRPIIEAIAPDGPFDLVTAALAAVGLGSVPAWLRPYHVLSNGERFRADLARVIAQRPRRIVIDEFTSVVDRQVARIGAGAFCKAWRRGEGQCVLLSCHRDILAWCRPDWVYDTASGQFAGRWLQPRPRIDVEIRSTDWRYWPLFEPHHYLKLNRPINCQVFVGAVDGELVSHLAVSTMRAGRTVAARCCRFVVMPQWQGAGVGMAFLEAIAARMAAGRNRWRRRLTAYINTSHPGLCRALRASGRWVQVSCRLHGDDKARSAGSIARSAVKTPDRQIVAGFGGHFRAIQGFRWIGPSE